MEVPRKSSHKTKFGIQGGIQEDFLFFLNIKIRGAKGSVGQPKKKKDNQT